MKAPIIIPTLNRYEHLRRCIESLGKNTLANETEIYISLDYPPSDKYIEGYNKVYQYLKSNLIAGFKEVHIFFQEKNLGPTENAYFLRREVYKKYDRFIFTEDDNEFSTNFLEYINKGLELFENNQEILAVCGYRNDEPWDFQDGNIAKITIFHAWGYATWKDKIEDAKEWINRKNFMYMLKNKDFCNTLYESNKKVYFTFIEALLASPADKRSVYIDINGDIREIDYTVALYMIACGRCVIIPQVSLVRNWGYDGSGENCGTVTDIVPEEKVIDDRTEFNYMIPSDFEINNTNQKILIQSQYSKRAQTAKMYRMIICAFGVNIARKVYNAIYLIKTLLRKQGK